MQNKKIHVSIVTPEGNAYEGDVDFLSIPATTGSMGILPNHIPIIAQLGVGIMKLIENGNPLYIGVSGGFMEFINNRANILTERAIFTEYDKRDEVIKELKKKHHIIQELTEETKGILHAIASMKRLRE